ncbi:hypothetical protein LUW75_10840 [Streptomyces sp. MRC013]|uniref:hypothetical protein n=1 Tax=Streptomyces sp. MRC013 TaxID=2898276 RepID=UPI00202602B2|nr:hypothetical protein [Streptomyces sp. MRC013]URM90409.1 hypothetical protein LUW75_10840 [Streptomyces sp. MRC013]
MHDRIQWLCELAGMAAGAAGMVLISAALGGLLGAGLALLVLSVPLLVIGNMKGGG